MSTDPTTVIVGANYTGDPLIYHTDPACQVVRDRINSPVDKPLGVLPASARECLWCSGEALCYAERRGQDYYDTSMCRRCGGLKLDGSCEWCETFDAIHAVPLDVDLDWLRAFAGVVADG